MLEGKRAEEGTLIAFVVQTMRAAWLKSNDGSGVTLKDCHPYADLVEWPRPKEMTREDLLQLKLETGL